MGRSALCCRPVTSVLGQWFVCCCGSYFERRLASAVFKGRRMETIAAGALLSNIEPGWTMHAIQFDAHTRRRFVGDGDGNLHTIKWWLTIFFKRFKLIDSLFGRRY